MRLKSFQSCLACDELKTCFSKVRPSALSTDFRPELGLLLVQSEN